MVNIFEKYAFNSILNNHDSGVTVCYSKRQRGFVTINWDKKIPKSCIEAPCSEDIELQAMYQFWCKYRNSDLYFDSHRFLSFIRRNDLESDYYEYERIYAQEAIADWANENSIVLNWDKLLIV